MLRITGLLEILPITTKTKKIHATRYKKARMIRCVWTVDLRRRAIGRVEVERKKGSFRLPVPSVMMRVRKKVKAQYPPRKRM